MEQDQIEERIFQIRLFSPRENYVRYPGFTVARGNMYSPGYRDCCGAVLLGPSASAITHYDWMNGFNSTPPEVYIPRVLEELSKLTDLRLKAAAIGGNRKHFNRLIEILEKEKIPVVGTYCDGWGSFGENGEENELSEKTIALDAENNYVFLARQGLSNIQLL